MRRFDIDSKDIRSQSKQESHIGPLVSTGDGGKRASLSNYEGTQLEGLKTLMPYGISSTPKKGMQAMAVSVDNDNQCVTGVYDKKRPKAKAGQLVLYSYGGAKISLNPDGTIDITAERVRINGREI